MDTSFSFGAFGAADSPSVATPTGSVADSTASAARAAATEQLNASPRKRGRPRKDASDGASNHNDLQARIDAEIARQLDQVHSPEAWGALLGMPADAAQVWTGKARWKLSDEERKTLGLTGSAAARTMMITNPKGLAFLMLASALMSAYVPRAIAELRDLREENAKKEKEATK